MAPVSATSHIGTFSGLDQVQMDGETEGYMGRKCESGTYKPTDKKLDRRKNRGTDVRTERWVDKMITEVNQG